MTNIKKGKELTVKKEKPNTLSAPLLPQQMIYELTKPTPKVFVKTRKGKAGLTLSYVEGGYMVKRLNEIFTPLGWNFRVKEQIIELNEVCVLGELTVKFPNNFEVTKSQFGTKERLMKMPLGDALKGAATDSLKKCASLFGIALDVYSSLLEDVNEHLSSKSKTQTPITVKKTREDVLDNINWIKTVKNTQTLLIAKNRIEKSDEYTDKDKKEMIEAINNKMKQLGNE